MHQNSARDTWSLNPALRKSLINSNFNINLLIDLQNRYLLKYQRFLLTEVAWKKKLLQIIQNYSLIVICLHATYDNSITKTNRPYVLFGKLPVYSPVVYPITLLHINILYFTWSMLFSKTVAFAVSLLDAPFSSKI